MKTESKSYKKVLQVLPFVLLIAFVITINNRESKKNPINKPTLFKSTFLNPRVFASTNVSDVNVAECVSI